MINFIVCDDNKNIREATENLILKIMIRSNDDYKIHSFKDYTRELKDLIDKDMGCKIYVLDIELPNGSGIDIARKIRNKDWDSSIIFLTAHLELKQEALQNRLLILSFISKYNNYKENLTRDLNKAMEIKNCRKTLTFTSNYVTYRININDIVYVLRDTVERKTIIKTHDNEYQTTLNLKEIKDKLDARFFQTHQSALVNVDHIKNIDSTNAIITFTNGKKFDYLTKDKRKALKYYVEHYN